MTTGNLLFMTIVGLSIAIIVLFHFVEVLFTRGRRLTWPYILGYTIAIVLTVIAEVYLVNKMIDLFNEY
jgi:hypothetical protein